METADVWELAGLLERVAGALAVGENAGVELLVFAGGGVRDAADVGPGDGGADRDLERRGDELIVVNVDDGGTRLGGILRRRRTVLETTKLAAAPSTSSRERASSNASGKAVSPLRVLR